MPLKFDDIKKLHQKKYRTELGYFLLEGEHLVLELQKAAVQNPRLLDSQLFITENYQHFASPLVKNIITAKQMAQLSDTKSPQGIIAVVPLLNTAKLTQDAQLPVRAIYLHEIQDPGNLGTILRSLVWFGGFRCLLSPNSVDPFNPKVVRSSMGAIFHTPLETDITVANLKARYSQFAYLDMQGSPISAPSFKNYPCYIFGNEARGVPHEALNTLNGQAFTIHGCGAIESLNLASAVNLCVYELAR